MIEVCKEKKDGLVVEGVCKRGIEPTIFPYDKAYLLGLIPEDRSTLLYQRYSSNSAIGIIQ